MRTAFRTIRLLTLFLAVAAFAWTISLATPSQSDITVVGLADKDEGGIPRCTLLDGVIKATNDSDTYDYKVFVTARAENDSEGNARCSGGQDCEDEQEPCECDFSVVVEVLAGTSAVGVTGCLFPSCNDCINHCDNVDCDLEPEEYYDHCVCVYGSYVATHYREMPDPTWYTMPPSSKTAIDETERDTQCPTSPRGSVLTDVFLT